MGVDARALHILFNTQWNMDGREASWVPYSEVPPEDLEFAKSAGIMQDAWELDHRSFLAKIIKTRDQLDRQAVAAAFVRSLLTRRLDTRSTLGSYARVLQLQRHRFREEKGRDSCRECGLTKQMKISVNHFTFRRIMWAGNIYQGNLEYALCDLAAFNESITELNREERGVLDEILTALRNLPGDAQLTNLEKSLAGLFPSNKGERQVTLEILGLCGILKPRVCPSLHETWIPPDEMPDPTHFFRKEWRSPVNCWTGEDGVNETAVEFWFGDL